MIKVPLTSTQPPAARLLSPDDFLRRIRSLESSPRVKVQKIGRSHGGRGIYCIVVAREDVVSQFEYGKDISNRIPGPWPTRSESAPHGDETQRRDQAMWFSALLMGLSFGHEASHVEALLALAERLASSDDDETVAILSGLIVLLVPMVNPDGRVAAIETWNRYPFAADGSAGNLYGFLLNRDFLHLTQPETAAILALYRHWNPIALLDLHEDVYLLGVEVPEVCWCPAFGQSTARDAPDAIREVVQSLGLAVAGEWEKRGFSSYREDMFMWRGSSSTGEVEWLFGMDGNVAQAISIHGIPAVMTESARTPGTQTWEDRIEQKVSAGLAFLKAVAGNAQGIAEAISSSRRMGAERARHSREVFIIPKLQRDRGAVAQLVDTLLRHGVEIFEVDEPHAAFMVPLRQTEAGVAVSLLSTDESKIHAMPPALGVCVRRRLRLEAPEESASQIWKGKPLSEPPSPTIQVHVKETDAAFAIPNTRDGVRFVNRILSAGYHVHWVLKPSGAKGRQVDAGTFIVAKNIRRNLAFFGRGLDLDTYGLPAGASLMSCRLRRPRVAIYAGQGTDRLHASARAELFWALKEMEFDFAALEAEDINAPSLAKFDVLLIPSGRADEIVQGWSRNTLLDQPPWQLPGEPRGIGRRGLEAIRAFVMDGGTYFGIDGGGGLLALPQFADLIDLEVVAHSLGLARVILRVEDPGNPVMFGLNGAYDEVGNWREGLLPAFYYTELLDGVPGGLVFRPKNGVRVLASYHAVDCEVGSRQVRQASLLTSHEGTVAIAYREVGKGQVIVTGIRPGFRAVWSNTWKLLSNAIFARTVPKN